MRQTVLFLALLAGTAWAAGDAEIIQSRIAHFREIGTAFKYIGDELKLKQPDMARIQDSARIVNERGADMLHWFPASSKPQTESSKSWIDTVLGWFSSEDSLALPAAEESHAKPDIWTNWTTFERAYGSFKAEAGRMWQAAQSGQAAAISAQHKKLGETCKGCHVDFREEID